MAPTTPIVVTSHRIIRKIGGSWKLEVEAAKINTWLSSRCRYPVHIDQLNHIDGFAALVYGKSNDTLMPNETVPVPHIVQSGRGIMCLVSYECIESTTLAVPGRDVKGSGSILSTLVSIFICSLLASMSFDEEWRYGFNKPIESKNG